MGELEGHTLNGLRSIVFEGTLHEFVVSVFGVLRRAPNLSNLEINNVRSRLGLELFIDDHLPNLSALRVYGFWISWTSPLLQNLTQLVMYYPHSVPPGYTSIETFLKALASCPDLETLDLADIGPDSLNGHQDSYDMVVQLRRLQDLRLAFSDPSRIGYILSHMEYPESAQLVVQTDDARYDPPEAISQVLPYRNVQTIQHFRKSKAIAILLGRVGFRFSTDNLLVGFHKLSRYFAYRENPQVLVQLASKIVEIVGGDTISSLHMETWGTNLPDEMWMVLLHGLPRLERICYNLAEEDWKFADTLVPVLFQPFEGGLVCPRLQYLELPKRILTQDTSVVQLERDACGKRLKRIGLSGDATEDD